MRLDQIFRRLLLPRNNKCSEQYTKVTIRNWATFCGLFTQFWILYKNSPIAKVIYFDFQEKKMSAFGSQYTQILGRCKLMAPNQNQVILPYQSPF